MNTGTTKSRLGHNITASANKLKLASLNKILKIDSAGGKKHKRERIAKQVSQVALSELIKSTPEGSQDIPDFKVFLSNEENVKVFREFLKTQYCSENIDFYSACETYRRLDPIDKVGQEMIKFMATQIYNNYLSENAPQRVNIDYNCSQEIVKQLKNPGPELLNDAQAEIFNLMKTSCYPRFCKTWRVDRETARRILSDRSILGSTTRTNVTTNSTISQYDDTLTSLNSTVQSKQSNPRGLKRKLAIQAEIECPRNCPYYRVGLPCQQHNSANESREEQRGKSDLIDEINLSRMHHVPDCCSRRTPPPPPLPPKPEPKTRELSPVINKKYCPYLGKVFDV